MVTKKSFYFFLFFCCILPTVTAQNIPSPKAHFGFNIGDNYHLATFVQTEAYFKKLAGSSDRAKYTVIGKTEEGRDQFMLIVTAPENHKKLEQYKLISQRLGNAEMGMEEAKQLAKEGKAVVWIDGGLHSTETVGIHQLIETAYQLLSRNDDETIRILNDVIILMTHANPDGQELVSNWYMRDSVPEKRSISNLPRLYEKYAGHDNNRDFYMFNLKESQNIGRQLYIEWIPQIMYNHHQSGPAGSVVAGAPYRDPFNYVYDPLIITGLDAMGAAMQNRLNAEGKPGYTSKSGSTYSTWYNGGLRTTTYFHNMLGLLTEIIGSPNPSDIPLVTSRLIPNAATPNPVTPQKWLFRQSIDYSVSLNYAVLNYASRNRDELLYNIYRMGKNSIDKGNKDTWTLSPSKIEAMNKLNQDSLKRIKSTANNEPSRTGNTIPVKFFDSVMKNTAYKDAYGYIIPADQTDLGTAVVFLNALIRAGVVVQKATTDFMVAGKNYPAKSFIVKTGQAFRPHIIDLFEPQDHPNDFQYPGGLPVAPYDGAGWTLAFQMGVKFDRIMEAFDGPFVKNPVGDLLRLNGSIVKSTPAKGYVLDARINQSFKTVNNLLNRDIDVYRITNVSKNSIYSNGSFFIPANAITGSILEKEVKENSVQVLAISEKPASILKIKKARIALWDTYGGSMPSGWIRWIMEQFNYSFTNIYARDIDTGDLRSKFDVIVFVSGSVPSYASRNNQNTGSNITNIPAEYMSRTGRMSADRSIPRLKIFLEQGGNIVTIGSSTQLAYYLNLPVTDAMVEIDNGTEKPLGRDKYYTPGSILRMTTDNTLLSASGLQTETNVYFDNSPVFHITPDAVKTGMVKPIGWFANDKPLKSGWSWGQAYLKNGVTAFEANVGKGKLFAFGPEITFRAQSYGTFKLLFNQLYGQ